MNLSFKKYWCSLVIISVFPVLVTVMLLLNTTERFSGKWVQTHKKLLQNLGSRLDQTQTLLVTFGRSGSSFTSDVIAQNKEVFYTFEPLSFLAREKEVLRVPEHFQTIDLEDFSRRVIESYLLCTFDFDTFTSLDNIHLRLSNSTKDLYECFQAEKIGMDHLECYFKFLQECKSRRMTFAKTIRFPVKWAQDLMMRHPKLKLIYLVRDPRATLNSQAKVFKEFTFPSNVTSVSANHCRQLGQDLEQLAHLRDTFPGRVKVFRYENGARDPTGFAAEIYDYLALPITQELTDFVTYLTSPFPHNATDPKCKNNTEFTTNTTNKTDRIKQDTDLDLDMKKQDTSLKSNEATQSVNGKTDMTELKYKGQCPFSTHRDDPVKAMEHWRHEIGFEVARVIDSHCGHLYQQLGYRAASTKEDLENTADISLVDVPQVEGII